jgi:nitrite reductase/ring-hydroxylating ferredoxin subunit
MNDVSRFIDSLVEQRTPEPFRPDETEAALMRAAIELRAGDAPEAGFVERLERDLAAEFASPSRESKLRTRRQVVQTAGIAAASLAAGVEIDRVVLSGASPAQAPQAAGTWHTVASSTDLPDGGVREFDLNTVAGFIHRTPDGVRAVSSVCTHLGCRLRVQAPEQLVCPCHGAIFAMSGEIVHYDLPIDLPPLPSFEVREQDGTIQVRTPPKRKDS